MRILFDCSNLKTGGALQNGLSFIKMAMHDNRHEWYIAVSYELSKQVPSEWEDKFAFFKRLSPLKNIIDYNNLRKKMLKIESTIKPDIVFSMFGPAYWRPTTVQVSGFAIPHFLYPDIDIFKNFKGISVWFRKINLFCLLKFKRRLFCLSDYLIAETDVVKKRGARNLNFPESHIYVVRNSYSPLFEEKIHSLTSKQSNKKNNTFVILIPSAWYYHKNLEIIPEIALYLKKSGLNNFIFRYTIDTNSSAWKNIQSKARKLGTVEYIQSAGTIPHADLVQEYHLSNAVCLPTLLECSTAVYPEAMATGVPIVTSDLDFAHDCCGEAALYFDPYDARQAAEKINQLIKQERLRKSLIESGYKELEKRYPSPEQKFENQLIILNDAYKRGYREKRTLKRY